MAERYTVKEVNGDWWVYDGDRGIANCQTWAFESNKETADLIASALNTRADGWISVKNKLPDANKGECGVPLWLCDDTSKVFEGICFVGLGDSSKLFYEHSDDGTKPEVLNNITHFQIKNIPAPPTKEN